MASILYKIGGLEVIEVINPPPIDKNIPVLPPSNTGANDPNIPSPVLPLFTHDTFKPLRDLSIPRPKPDGNAKVGKDDELIYVFFPANPLMTGDKDKWVPYTQSQYNQLVASGAITP